MLTSGKYVSGSPVQFYPFLQPFIKQNFIPGPITLKNFTLDTIPEMLDFGGVTRSDIFEFKTTEIEKIFNMFPAKQFVAMGDSTQKDPEVYSTMYDLSLNPPPSCLSGFFAEGIS